MRKRINIPFLRELKQRTIDSDNPYLKYIFGESSKHIGETYRDVVRPFHKICVHSARPENLIQTILSKSSSADLAHPLSVSIANEFNGSLKVEQLKQQYSNENITFQQQFCLEGGRWIGSQDKYDLILSDLQLHLHENMEGLFKGYLDSLKNDGSLIGCCYGESTLRQLYWSYIMAQNERSGGISPKLLGLPSIGYLGSMLTSSHFQLCSMVNFEYEVQLQSAIDLLSVLQQIGQSGYVHGRRKAVFKDVLLAMLALYQCEFTENPLNSKPVFGTFELINFIGWKYDESQPKPLPPGQVRPQSRDFVQQIKQLDKGAKHFVIRNEGDDPEQIK